MPGNVGPLEIAIVLVIALIVLGPKRLPEVGRSLGKGLREFKESLSSAMNHDDDHDDDDHDEIEDHDEIDVVEADHAGVPRD
jgi:sec-independent protein translocase protein TatA